MKILFNFSKILVLSLFVSCTHNSNQQIQCDAHSPAFITISHSGDEDRPINGLIIVRDDEYIKDQDSNVLFYSTFIISKFHFEILKNFCINYKLNKDPNCNFYGPFGTVSIKFYGSGTCKCFYLGIDDIPYFLYNLRAEVSHFMCYPKLEKRIEEMNMQIIGSENYKIIFQIDFPS